MSLFCCPNCGEKLERREHAIMCPKGHSFDIARSGYVNLLLSQQIKAKHHGDDKAMVAARRDFLDLDYYDPMRQTMLDLAETAAVPGMAVLDSGCGEGYYTAELTRRLEQKGFAPKTAAIDISKDALILAAKRCPEAEYAVASCFHLPVAENSVDLLLSVFAPYSGDEFLRVLRPGGHLLMVIPLEYHLWGLKQAIYEHPYQNEVKDYALDGFLLEEHRELRYSIHLDTQEKIHNLFLMTPYYYKTSASDQAKVAALDSLDTPIEFGVLLYRRSK